MEVTVPVGSIATVYIPAKSGQYEGYNLRAGGFRKNVIENGQSASEAPGLTFIGFSDGYAVFDTTSGQYLFKSFELGTY